MKKLILSLIVLVALIIPVTAQGAQSWYKSQNFGSDKKVVVEDLKAQIVEICSQVAVSQHTDNNILEARVNALEARFGALEQALVAVMTLMSQIGSFLAMLTLKN